ncbi:glucose dehydrogenase [FAD, quinone]-like [Penaeus chinensis]|uniref:glucose dehydrogenase [FAD, quinone]-like n=1 Tax=Penaeus chinensis TaxID=139456 RepID=UPI001FB82C74|nr:glucose dehydrogenase [FAD, quinone]-like [Penaeus chinensis]
MAARLSEVREWKVLLLEAGGVPTSETRVPGLSRLFYFPSAVNWNYELAPQRHGLRNYDNRSSPVPQGRVLGGSSSINGMLYVRGNRRDYDNWAALGNPGWDYEAVLPYFKKSEDYRGPHRGETEHYHGRGGPYTVTPKEGPHLPITGAFLRAGQHLGFDVIDPSGPEQIGFAPTEYVTRNGERWSTARAYLQPAARRPNLHVVHSAFALKVPAAGCGGRGFVCVCVTKKGRHSEEDIWAALGNPGWDYEAVLPYFKKSEDYRGPHRGETEHYHGRGGPYTVTPKEGPHLPITGAFLRAGQHLGFDVIDPSGPEQIGFAPTEYVTRNGERWSTARAYLQPAARRPNLHVVHSAFALKIIFDKKNRAVGVVYKHNDQIKTVYARREVILSTGALVSPKLLMLSGVGARQQLRQHGIKVVADLPGVGQNLQDHMCLYGLTWNVDVRTPNVAFDAVNPGVIRQYASERKGLYATPLGEFGHAWSRVSGEGDPYWPDVQLFMVSSGLGQEGLMAAHALGLNSGKFMEYYSPQFGRPGITMMPYLMRPKSRGAVLLKSRNPFDAPIVDPNYLSHPDDIDTLVHAIKWALKVGQTPPFAKGLGAKFYSRPLPQCQAMPYGSDAYWRCFVLHMATTFYHFGGTCKMGPESDPYSVLDEKLRVRGVYGLRVVDGSSMPVVTSGNIMSAIVMMAEKTSDLIKSEWAPAA